MPHFRAGVFLCCILCFNIPIYVVLPETGITDFECIGSAYSLSYAHQFLNVKNSAKVAQADL